MNEIHNLEIANSGILVLYNMSSLFTNIPLDEAIKVLANKAFTAFTAFSFHSFQLSQLLAHLYGLPKTHEEGLAMCPILSAKQTYNYA